MGENAKTLIGSYTYARTMLLLRVNQSALQARLPAPWEVASLPGGAQSGANLAVGFCDVLRSQDAAGNPTPTPSNRYLPFNGPARNPVTGELVNMWYRAFSVHPEALIGWGQATHNPALSAMFSSTQSVEGHDLKAVVTERFEIHVAGGGTIELEVRYQRGPFKPYAWQRNIRSPADPSYVLHYKNDELRDEVRNATEAVDRIRNYRFRVAVPELVDLFDGTEELVAMMSVPWSLRQVFKLR